MASPIASSSSTPMVTASLVHCLPNFYALQAQPPTQPCPQRVRLTTEGIRIQRAFYDNVSKNPTKEQAEELLAQIRVLYGCGHHTIERLKLWFKRQREKSVSITTENTSSNGPHLPSRGLCKKLYPSFEGPSTIKYLRELMLTYPRGDPPGDMLDIWASQLNIAIADIQRWLALENGKEQKPNIAELESPSQKRQLPTPQSTASPEPEEETDDPPPLKKLRTLADWISEATPQSSSDSAKVVTECPRVNSIAEFAERFAPFEAQFQLLKDKFEEGGFATIIQ